MRSNRVSKAEVRYHPVLNTVVSCGWLGSFSSVKCPNCLVNFLDHWQTTMRQRLRFLYVNEFYTNISWFFFQPIFMYVCNHPWCVLVGVPETEERGGIPFQVCIVESSAPWSDFNFPKVCSKYCSIAQLFGGSYQVYMELHMLHIPNSAEGNCLTEKENHTLCLKSDIK